MLNKVQNEFIQFLKTKNELAPAIIQAIRYSMDEFNMMKQSCNNECLHEELSSLLEDYLSSKKMQGCSSGTVANYRYNLDEFVTSLTKPIELVDQNDIQDELIRYKESGVSMQSVEHRRLVLCSFFQWLVDVDKIEKNPAKKIHKIKYSQKERQPLSPLELEKMRSACRTARERAILEFFFSTGCRVSELINASMDDLDIESGTVDILGKGGKYNTCFLNSQALFHLKMYIENRTDGSSSVFVSNRNHKYTKEGIEHMIKAIAVRAGIQKKITPHTIRHTTATVALRKGMPVEEVSRLLGHSSINTTMIYAKIDKSKLRHDHSIYLA